MSMSQNYISGHLIELKSGLQLCSCGLDLYSKIVAWHSRSLGVMFYAGVCKRNQLPFSTSGLSSPYVKQLYVRTLHRSGLQLYPCPPDLCSARSHGTQEVYLWCPMHACVNMRNQAPFSTGGLTSPCLCQKNCTSGQVINLVSNYIHVHLIFVSKGRMALKKFTCDVPCIFV